jgi:hypothetical protein
MNFILIKYQHSYRVSSNPAHGVVDSIEYYVIKFENDLRQVCGFPMNSGFFRQ